ncbi:hypothetical protein [Enterococcus faecalis]|uniref:hypothetical protein n=1 Tax=Enterococcus faecalis TaxID=1351 RepID=UPI000B6B0FEE|nr:hypothetical protein [Enterococcus faecalis]MDK8156567.1 hypothetical protein [Enterococcus faecalis]MDK8201403.1 hypothetical protein [Enterococcus faecalis]MDU3684320.1 hypothetical protein [Enterococcus faecalis]PNK94542.1 hypothetical protein CEQ25_007760 [Enterococcus faecalis]
MLKKPFLLFFSLLGAIFILASCGIGKDAVTDTKYKVSLQQAAEIYEKEAGNNKPLVNVQFDTEPASDYSYIFTNDTETLYVNPETGKVTKNTEANQLGEDVKTTTADEKVTLDANE